VKLERLVGFIIRGRYTELYISGNVLILRFRKVNEGSGARLQRVRESANHICANFRLRGTHPQT